MFKALVLCELYNLSNEQFEYQIRDRLSSMRFLGRGLEDPVPDATLVRQYREPLVQAREIEELFGAFDAYLKAKGWLAMGGQMIYASFVPVPKQYNDRDENAAIKGGETPEGWADRPAKKRQKDTNACWTKKHGKSHYGRKNHLNVERRLQLIRRYNMTDTFVHDTQVIDDILDNDDMALAVRAGSAYGLAEIEEKLEDRSLKSLIHRKSNRDCSLTKRQQQGNKTRLNVRARVEHVPGAQTNDMGDTLVRSIGVARTNARIGLMNLAYNMRLAVPLWVGWLPHPARCEPDSYRGGKSGAQLKGRLQSKRAAKRQPNGAFSGNRGSISARKRLRSRIYRGSLSMLC